MAAMIVFTETQRGHGKHAWNFYPPTACGAGRLGRIHTTDVPHSASPPRTAATVTKPSTGHLMGRRDQQAPVQSVHLPRPAHGELHQMIHKCLKAHVVGEDGLSGLADTAVTRCRMRCRGIEFRKEESCLRTTGVTVDETREGEAILQQVLWKLERDL